MSATVFISYATADKFFAELLEKKLLEKNISAWRDRSSLHAGEEWRQSIDLGILESSLMIVVLSTASCSSHYVTYEWATALAHKKPIVPVMLEPCDRHPKLEPLQYVDFMNHDDGTWERLLQRIRELWDELESEEVGGKYASMPSFSDVTPEQEYLASKIIAYLNRKGFRMMSFDRIRSEFGDSLTNELLGKLTDSHRRFVRAKLGNRPGLGLI